MGREKNGEFGSSAARPSDAPASPTRTEISAMFVTQDWHKLYGEALLEADPAKLPEAIAVAKREILTRYLAPWLSLDENVDLMHAVTALSRLKKSSLVT
jgi:hypothetical protein